MLISYKLSYKIPKSTLVTIHLELYSNCCNYQIRYFRTHILYITSNYFDYDKDHQKKFMEIMMKHAGEYIISFHFE